MKYLLNLFTDLFQQMDLSASLSHNLAVTICIIALLIVAFIAQVITRFVLRKVVHQFVEKTKTQWDDFLIKRKVFGALAHLASAFIIYSAFSFTETDFSFENFEDAQLITKVLYKIARIYFVLILTVFGVRLATAANDMYRTTSYAANRPIKGYVQLVQIFIIFIGVIFIISILINRSPLVLIAGLGAVAAVLLLIFRDTILGFVASIQLSANKMLKPGDWISMPGHGADGTVIDITLNTVKVQNWDKTITTIPTYALVAESFSNWVGMEESGGRRIKRHINIDMKSVRFCDGELLEKLGRFHLLSNYLKNKQKEIENFNKKLNIEEGDTYNGRRQTNLGVFRRYLELYLHQHPMIHDGMTFLIRHLQPTDKGLPVEIYVFSRDQEWANYEAIQADIMDHVLAILPEFDLRVFQTPSGSDISEFLVSRT